MRAGTTANRSRRLRIWAFREAGVLGVLVVMGAGLTLATRTPGGSTFLSAGNLLDVARQFSFVAIMAVGELFVILTGGIDLSVAAVLALAGVVMAKVMVGGAGTAAGIIVGLLTAVAVGAVNGALVVKARLPAFIATLGTLSVCRGLAYAVSRGHPISGMPKLFTQGIGQGTVLGVPVSVAVMVAITLFGWLLLARTRWGRYLYAVGGNEEAARFAGVPVGAAKILAYVLCAATAGISAILMTAWLGTAQSTAMLGGELDVIAATVIGGASLMGGVGTALGAVLGAAIMGVLRNGLVLLNCPAYYRDVSVGLVVVLAVAMDRLRKE
ncbi:MAG: ABC transporter permease [Armatimonadetes bacterium]|nr:ABC transporter permease [Armatimonadota bacterium]